MSTVAGAASKALAPPAEVVNIPEDVPVVYEEIQFNSKPTFAEKANALCTTHYNYIKLHYKILKRRSLENSGG